MSRVENRLIGPEALRALAHPLRVRLLDLVSARGAATASMLAKVVGESSGATSYHLRQLAKHGLIEEDVDRGTAKERWWRPVPGGFTVTGAEFAADPATRDAARIVIDEFHRHRTGQLRHWLDTALEWPVEWVDSSVDSKASLRLAPAQLRALVSELFDVIERYRAVEPGDAAAAIEVQLNAFPLADPVTGIPLALGPPAGSRVASGTGSAADPGADPGDADPVDDAAAGGEDQEGPR